MKRVVVTISLMKKLWLLLLWVPSMATAQDAFEEVVENEANYFTPIDSTQLQPFQERMVPDSVVKRFQNDASFWYANRALPKKKAEEPSIFLRLLRQQWFRNLMWVIICLSFGAVLLWFLATSNIRLFRRSPETIQEFSDTITTENIFSIDYDKEIEKAVRQGAFRLAIRLHYLQLLALLSIKELIRYKQDATNSDYLFELSGTTYYKPFFTLTRHFEYTWYGQFEVTPVVYEAMQKDFHSFKSSMA